MGEPLKWESGMIGGDEELQDMGARMGTSVCDLHSHRAQVAISIHRHRFMGGIEQLERKIRVPVKWNIRSNIQSNMRWNVREAPTKPP